MKNIGYIVFQLLLLGSLSAQEVIVGKLVMQNNPPMTDPVLPGLVLGLETDSKTYILTQNHQWIEETFVAMAGETYQEGSLVEVAGTTEEKLDITGQVFTELEIESIIYAQSYYSGKLVRLADWPENDTVPIVPGLCRWGLETEDAVYYFTRDSILLPTGDFVVNGVRYDLFQPIVVFAEKYVLADGAGNFHTCLDVIRVEESVSTEEKKVHPSVVYLNEHHQIVFQERWSGGSFDFTLFDTGGKSVLARKISGEQVIDVSFLPTGVYVYCIAKGSRLIEAGKVIKKR